MSMFGMFGEGNDYCKHDNVRGYCHECRAEKEREEKQKAHEASVAKQKLRLKVLDRSNIVSGK